MKHILTTLGLVLVSIGTWAETYQVTSPDGRLVMDLSINNGTKYELTYDNTKLIEASSIGMNLADGRIIGNGTVKETKTDSKDEMLEVFIGKNKSIHDAYNELLITFNEGYELKVRVYNEGAAWRFITHLNDEITIQSEDAIFNFTATPKVYFPECDSRTYNENDQHGIAHPINQGFRNFERLYKIYNSPTDIPTHRFSVSPMLCAYPDSPYKIVITEADTYDYPGLYMEANGEKSMRGMWAGYPKEIMDDHGEADDYYSNHLVITRENYIAKTSGTRTFPWRVIIVEDEDKALLNNELVYLLAEPCRLKDTSWIMPGKSGWEWWHKAVLEGVDFPSGNKNLSLQLYKYYVDWCSANGIEYMTLDAGWSESYIQALCQYARMKKVKILVWTWASNVREAPEDWIKKMKRMGVSGAKIDFFERNDQIAMRWGYDFAQRLADEQMVAIYHGCPVPAGLNRTYPNILNFEAVRGAESNFWEYDITPDHHLLFPFIRSLAGPEDYTPGSLRNTTKEDFRPIDKDNTPPMSMGTRSHELGMYLVFDHWIGYLCDSPTEYNKFPDILNFLSSVPTVWDKTIPLDAQLGEYIVNAKQTGLDWYVGGMTNWTARNVEVPFDFLEDGVTYKATIFKDAPNSSEQPKEYICITENITKSSKLTFNMAEGGGFAIYLQHPNSTSINTVKSKKKISISVNEQASTLHINSTENIGQVRMIDLSGYVVWSHDFNYKNNNETINTTDLGKKFFIISIALKNGELVTELVKL